MVFGLIRIDQTPQVRRNQLASTKSSSKQKCWIWFKGDPLKTDDGRWMSGWMGSVAPKGGIRCEHHDYVPCRLPQWRVSWDEPKDLKAPPEIPEGAEWKHWPVD